MSRRETTDQDLKGVLLPNEFLQGFSKNSDPKILSQLDGYKTNRRVPRRFYRQLVGCLSRGTYRLSHSIQMGEGGLLLELDWPIKENDSLVLTFKVPMGSYWVVRARVQYLLALPKEAKKVGVTFEGLDFQARREIRNFVAVSSNPGPRK